MYITQLMLRIIKYILAYIKQLILIYLTHIWDVVA
uniref:Uncharacterized protein n=1 Tax=CrAss-like virus sp. ctYsL76 TaxID=2826826 RepID=A0A8S5QMQ0_9CAUD|nr:MAG TPA: hypothetical protein [CrAss-like virus sp. ctYsL76]